MNDVATRGRRATVLDMELLGEVTEQDLAVRQEGLPSGGQTPSLARIRGIHHELAKMLASGLSETEVGAATGYCVSRISVLKKDPAFKELISFYQNSQKEVFRDMLGQVKTLASDAVGELQSRLETNPESFSVSSLTELAKMSLDRAGLSPVQKSVQASVDLTGLSNLKAKAKEQSDETATFLEQLPSSQGTD